jgi:phage gp29-like protein
MLDDKDLTALVDAISKLTTASVVIPNEPWIREFLGIPEEEPGLREQQDINVVSGSIPKRTSKTQPNTEDVNNDPNKKPDEE